MMKETKWFLTKLISGLILISMISVGLFPYIVANESDIAFTPNNRQLDDLGNEEIRLLIVQAGAHLLEAQSQYSMFLYKVELFGIEDFSAFSTSSQTYPQFQTNLNKTIENLQKAHDKYIDLEKFSSTTPYNTTVIDALAVFDYGVLSEELPIDANLSKTSCVEMNSALLTQVEAYLSEGNVVGVYGWIKNNTFDMLEQLKDIQANFALTEDLGSYDELFPLWKLNQLFTVTVIFGQYVAEVFYSIQIQEDWHRSEN